jgi:hypothetical protein
MTTSMAIIFTPSHTFVEGIVCKELFSWALCTSLVKYLRIWLRGVMVYIPPGLYVNSLLFYKSWHNCVHNCLNTCLYVLWTILILNLMYNISFFFRFVFDKFIIKRGECRHKIGRTLANQVDKRRNMINDYLRGKAYNESVRGSWFQGECWSWDFSLVLSFSCSFRDFAAFRAFCWLLRFSFF